MYIDSSLTPSSCLSYSSALQSYKDFCTLHNLDFPPTANTLSLFITFCSHVICPSFISSYLSAVVSQIEPYYPDVCQARQSPLVWHTLVGVLRVHGQPIQHKHPLTPADLLRVCDILGPTFQYDDLLFVTQLFLGSDQLLHLGTIPVSTTFGTPWSVMMSTFLQTQFAFSFPVIRLTVSLKAPPYSLPVLQLTLPSCCFGNIWPFVTLVSDGCPSYGSLPMASPLLVLGWTAFVVSSPAPSLAIQCALVAWPLWFSRVSLTTLFISTVGGVQMRISSTCTIILGFLFAQFTQSSYNQISSLPCTLHLLYLTCIISYFILYIFAFCTFLFLFSSKSHFPLSLTH